MLSGDELNPLLEILTASFDRNLALTVQQREALATVRISTSDLADGVLGYFTGGLGTGTLEIVLDDDGHGWNTSLDSVDDGRYDLPTALAHELGHAVGYSHEHADGADNILNETLSLGTRRTSFAGSDDFFADTLSAGTAID